MNKPTRDPISFYLALLASFACIGLFAVTAFLGLSYVYQGHGLHPYFAGAVCIVCGALAYFFAHQAQKSEDSLI